MSLVGIVEHNEVIFHILDKPPMSPPRTPRYESQLERQLKQAKTEQRRRTMGYAETPLAAPSQFLRKGGGVGPLLRHAEHSCVKGYLPPVPRRDDIVRMRTRPKAIYVGPLGWADSSQRSAIPTVNFRVVNIRKAIKSKPKPAEPRLVDTRDGHIKKLQNSGEIPQYSLRPDFGQLPNYLRRANKKKKIAMEKRIREEEQRENLCKLINEEDRQNLLKDLKVNWQLMQKAFLQLPMLTDTIPKILKKTKMEAELRQLEKDIAVVEMNPYIYVYDG